MSSPSTIERTILSSGPTKEPFSKVIVSFSKVNASNQLSTFVLISAYEGDAIDEVVQFQSNIGPIKPKSVAVWTVICPDETAASKAASDAKYSSFHAFNLIFTMSELESIAPAKSSLAASRHKA